MFNIGFSELILILLVAFVIVGPRDLPKVAGALGRGFRTVKNMYRDFKEETGLDEVEKEFKDASSDLKKTMREVSPAGEVRAVEKELRTAEKEIRSTGRELEKEIRTAEKEVRAAEKEVRAAKK